MFIIFWVFFFLTHIAISNIFKPTSQHYRNPSSNALVALPSFHPALKSSESSDGQTVSKLVSLIFFSKLYN